MKILQISDNKIFGFGGGSLEEHKYYEGIRTFAKQHGHEFRIISPDAHFEASFDFHLQKDRKIDMLARLMGHSSYICINWLKMRKLVYAYQPDMVVLGRSRMGMIARDIKKKLPNCRVVSNMENVEFDYVDGYFANAVGFAKKVYIAWEKQCVKRDEKMAIKWSDTLNYLTKRDKRRTHELYPLSVKKREIVLPICIQSGTELTLDAGKNVVFIGSLGYQSNIEAITEFVENIWKPFYADRNDIHLIVGGSNPSEELKMRLAEIPNCKLYENFKCLKDIVPRNSMMIAPIQHGAGMKVKVAETLSMGLMIAASDEALVGYENAVKHDSLGGIIRANTCNDYRDAIQTYSEKGMDELQQIADQNKTIYRRFYSYEVSNSAISELCHELLDNFVAFG